MIRIDWEDWAGVYIDTWIDRHFYMTYFFKHIKFHSYLTYFILYQKCAIYVKYIGFHFDLSYESALNFWGCQNVMNFIFQNIDILIHISQSKSNTMSNIQSSYEFEVYIKRVYQSNIEIAVLALYSIKSHVQLTWLS